MIGHKPTSKPLLHTFVRFRLLEETLWDIICGLNIDNKL